MTARHEQIPDPNQPSLFDTIPETGNPDVPEQGAQTIVEAPLESKDGPSVTLESRSAHLQEALGHIAQANMRAGFAVAADTHLRKGIEDRYGSRTKGMLEGAEYNREQAYKRAKTEFAIAFGKMAMLDSGMDRAEVDAIVDDAWNGANEGSDKKSFLGEYADTANRTKRDNFRKQLKKGDRIRVGKKR